LVTWSVSDNTSSSTSIEPSEPSEPSKSELYVAIDETEEGTLKVTATSSVIKSISDFTTVTVIATPTAPQDLTARVGDAYQVGQLWVPVELSWTAPKSDGGYDVEKYQYQLSSAGENDWENILDPSITTCIVPDLMGGTEYTFRVRAVNSQGDGAVATLTYRIPATVPDAPRDLTATRGNAQVDLSWEAPDHNGGSAVTKYEYHQYPPSAEGDGWHEISGFNADAPAYTVSGLANGTTYTFKVRAVNHVGGGAATAATTATPATVPDAPQSLTATRG
jgi:titin